MGEGTIGSIRDCIESFKDEVVTIDKEVNPICEMAGIQQALEESYAVLFTNIKGYPGVRSIGNVFSRADRVAKMFNVDEPKKLKFKCLDAIKNPLLPRIIEDAPCQEVVITDNIDVMATIPIIKHSPRDGGRVLGSGVSLFSGEYSKNGMDVAFRRAHFKGKDWGTTVVGIGSHVGQLFITELKGRDVPLTLNICAPPAINMVAATLFIHSIVPAGANEVAIAGALQGSPIDIVKAKTVDAYAIANSEWVIEGYVNSSEEVWEADDAEAESAWKMGKLVPFFPEWSGLLKKAHKRPKLHVTAITHRKDRPIFFSLLSKSYEADNLYSPMREACFYELAERLAPGFVTDVHILPGVGAWSAYVAIQVRKREPRDEGLQQEILAAYLAENPRLSLAIAVDEDVDICSPQDLLWAMANRWNTSKGIVKSTIRSGLFAGTAGVISPGGVGIGIDATVPWDDRDEYERTHYASDTIDLSKWIPEEKIAAALQMQSEYAKILAKTGH